ncbi:TPA: hypothetical protein ACHTCR_005629 [Pseudomonas putida]|uniref:hypothetical protein n=1 Tax=Pseudomonas putida TaxID=303 RepID=UPI000F3C1CF0|nr:hypothetical protein [Pseudomonas putida]RNF66479.1 hypothetical protein EFJ98_24365 [Pseudomonas putida]
MMAAQKLEFALYGMASHLKEKGGQFKNLTPEDFLRGDGSNTKATLGALVREFGPKFDMGGKDLIELVRDRNLIAHDYWRMSRAKIEGGRSLENPIHFLVNFTKRCEYWISVCRGWVAIAMVATAEQAGRLDELDFTPEMMRGISDHLLLRNKSMAKPEA